MTVRMRPGTPFHQPQPHTRASGRRNGNAAERLVAERWSAYLKARREARAGAFAAYLAALDAAEAAAGEPATLPLGEAA